MVQGSPRGEEVTVAVLTADYGKYDIVRPVVPQTHPVDEWLFVTDDPDRVVEAESKGWTGVLEPRPHVHTNVAAKVPKFRPDLYTKATYTVWKDAGADISEHLVEEAIRSVGASPMSMFRHPVRVSSVDEAAASRGLPKYNDLPLEYQVAHYMAKGYPNDRLWATGFIVRNHAYGYAPLHQLVGDSWLTEVVRWGFQDQLSFAYLHWYYRDTLDIRPMPWGLWACPHISFGGHIWSP